MTTNLFAANLAPAFNVTRASHAVLTARDLDATQAFYCDMLGLILSRRDPDALYLRGIEERSHHSLVFRKSDKPPVCERIGLRVLTEDDLDRAAQYFGENGFHATFVERPYQGRTLHVDDSIGTPLEFCAVMDDLPTNLQKFELYKGASPWTRRTASKGSLASAFPDLARPPIRNCHFQTPGFPTWSAISDALVIRRESPACRLS